MKQRYFVTATGTEIGKSFITAALVQQAQVMGRSVMAYKPVISGFDPHHPDGSDTSVILESLKLPLTTSNIDRVSPWQFRPPLAPSMAARLEGRVIDFDEIVRHNQAALKGAEDLILIEGVGGVMVPLNDKKLVTDWISALNISAILVSGAYLGTISHTLTALAALREKNIPVRAIIINESQPSSVPLSATLEELNSWTKVPLLAVKYDASSKPSPLAELSSLIES